MTPQAFKAAYWADIEAVCGETGLNPLFVAAQAALETGWGRSAIGNNLFGITAGGSWRGLVQVVTTTEYFCDSKQGRRFKKVHSVTRMPDGRYRYRVDRTFRDYLSVRDCMLDHFRVLSLARYASAMPYCADVYEFALRIARCGYCTAKPTDYASSIVSISKTIAAL